MKYHTVLSIAGSDSGGGAGIQADIKTISACGAYASTAITAISVQNTLGVKTIYPLPQQIVAQQIEAVLDDIGADAIKIGMLNSREIVEEVSRVIHKYQIQNIVLDPVMVAGSGKKLLQNEAVLHLKKQLIPQSRVITPNIPEASVLLGQKISKQQDLFVCARNLAEKFEVSVLLKSGHLDANELVDVFFDFEKSEITSMKSTKLHTLNTHGTGCTMSSAFATYLAQGFSLKECALKSKEYIEQSIQEGMKYEIGKGNGPVHHFCKIWNS